MDRCCVIAFSAHQNTENEHKEALYKRTELTIPLISGLGTIVRLHVCSYHPGKMKHSRFYTSYNDNKLANTETLFNIVWLGKLNNGRKYVFKSSKCRK